MIEEEEEEREEALNPISKEVYEDKWQIKTSQNTTHYDYHVGP